MAATTTKSRTFVPDLDAATERAREANDRLAEAGRKVTTAYLDGVEKYVAGFRPVRAQGRRADPGRGRRQPPPHPREADRGVVKASVSAARELIAA